MRKKLPWRDWESNWWVVAHVFNEGFQGRGRTSNHPGHNDRNGDVAAELEGLR